MKRDWVDVGVLVAVCGVIAVLCAFLVWAAVA